MKMTSKKLALVTLLTSGMIMSVSATEFNAVDESVETNLCIKAAEGNRVAMFNEMRNSGYSDKFIAAKVTCNGENILAFVEKHGKNPEKMLNMLDRRTRHTSITDIAKNTLEEK